jgi:(R)-2-hydroxyglutarate---pyruvate transhydrogenase
MAAKCPRTLTRLVRQIPKIVPRADSIVGDFYCIPSRRPSPALFRHFSQSFRYQETSDATTTADTDPVASHPKQVKYTTESYPDVKRDPKFSEITSEHVRFFKDTLGGDAAVIDGVTSDAGDDLEAYNSDWMRKYRGQTKLVVKPKTTEEVSKVLKYCNDKMLAVVPQGGNSGLVGGSVPVFDEIVISTSRMNNIRSFDEVSGILVVDAGCILEVVDNFLAEKSHIFPLDLGAKGSCHIGGNVATNAGGLRLLRYGSLHGNVLGIEAVLPDGTIVDDLSKLRKNNTGYDLKQLFIGGEGTIGLITAVSVICPQRPKAINVAYFGLESFEKVQQAYREAKSQLSEILSAFELMDGQTQDFVHQVTGNKRPLEGRHPFYCLVETSGSNTEHDNEKLEHFLESVMGSDIVADGVLAQDETQVRALWGWREGITEAIGHFGGTYKYDLSIPLPELYSLVEETRERLSSTGLIGDDDSYPALGVVGYGHMGDSNLHLNIPVRRYTKEVEAALEPWVYEWIQKRNGSISAEHGLGIAKKAYIGYSRSETMIRLMKQIKDLYDPKGIMNPYKYI